MSTWKKCPNCGADVQAPAFPGDGVYAPLHRCPWPGGAIPRVLAALTLAFAGAAAAGDMAGEKFSVSFTLDSPEAPEVQNVAIAGDTLTWSGNLAFAYVFTYGSTVGIGYTAAFDFDPAPGYTITGYTVAVDLTFDGVGPATFYTADSAAAFVVPESRELVEQFAGPELPTLYGQPIVQPIEPGSLRATELTITPQFAQLQALSFPVAPVPEPSTTALIGAALLGMLGMLGRRRA